MYPLYTRTIRTTTTMIQKFQCAICISIVWYQGERYDLLKSHIWMMSIYRMCSDSHWNFPMRWYQTLGGTVFPATIEVGTKSRGFEQNLQTKPVEKERINLNNLVLIFYILILMRFFLYSYFNAALSISLSS